MSTTSVENLYKSLIQEGNAIIKYQGAITSDNQNKILDSLENKSYLFERKIFRKIFFISVELLQNIYHHAYRGDKTDKDLDYFIYVLSLIGNNIVKINAGNYVDRKKMNTISSRINQLNLLTKEELRILYKKVLSNKEFSEKGGGGLGMIEMLRKSENPIDYKYIYLNKNLYFFNFSIILKKN
jgi:hypothetical protein